MAGYREHISVSGMLGFGYGFGAVFAFGFTPIQGMLAAFLSWVSGMLPDLDSQSGKPVRELFGVTAAIAPLFLVQHMTAWGTESERVMLFALMMYVGVRYGGAIVLGKLSVHRGMFHSIPAMIIAAEIAFLSYRSSDLRVKALMAGAVAVGFLSHLLLDELYSVRWDGTRIKLAKSAGSAMKFVGNRFVPNAFTYGLLFFLTYTLLVDVDILRAPGEEPVPIEIREAIEIENAPVYR